MSTAEVQDVQDDIHKVLKEQHQLEQLGHHEHGHVNGVNGNGMNGHEEHHNGHQDEVDGGGHSKPRENHCDVTAAGEDDGVQDEAVKGHESGPAAPEHTEGVAEEKEAHRDSTEEEAHPAEPKEEAVVVEAHPAEPKAEAVVVEAHPAEPKAEAVVVEAHPAEPKAEAVVVEAHPAETKEEVVVEAHHEATADAHHEAHHEHPAEPRGEDDTGDTPVKELRQKYLDKRQSSLEMKREVESQSRPVINKAAMSTSVDERSVREAYEDVRSDTTTTDWAVFKFEAQKIVCAATGEGFDSFRDHFTDDERAFGFIRIQMGDEMSKRQKFVFLTWVGPQVSVIRRAKMTIDKGLVKDIIKNFAVELQVESQSEINVDYIREQLARAGGANYGTGFRD